MTLRHRIAALLRQWADRIDRESNVDELESYADFCQRLADERRRETVREMTKDFESDCLHAYAKDLARRELPDAVAREVEACKVITFTR